MSSNGCGDWDRTSACSSQSAVPYHLATPQDLVPRTGVEPECLSARDFKSLASTYFATRAELRFKKANLFGSPYLL